jgi:parallel beta-helix repeat protein
VASYETIIEDSSTGGSTFNSPQTAILVDSLYSGSVVIDGLSVQGASTGTATAGITVSGSSATVAINNVTAAGGSGSTHSSGVFVRFYSPNVTITDSTLTGGASANTAGLRVYQAAGADVSDSTVSGGVAPGAGDSYSYGITVSGVPSYGSTIAAWNNTINGGTAEHARGIWVGTESDGTITGNTIDGGDTNVADGSATGIYVYDQSNPVIANNWIFSGDAEPDALTDDDEGTVEGIRIDDESDPVIRNNIIIAGLGENSRGISISAGIDGTLPPSSPVIVNNTIDAGYGETTGAVQGPAWGIAVENTTATIKNNIIYVHGAASSNYGIDTVFVGESVGSPTIEYNYVYVGGGDDTRATDIYAGAGNVTGGAAPGFTAYTADYDPTNDEYTLTDGSPVNVRGGGADLSALGYSADYLGATRTTAYDTGSGSVTNGGDGWSMGAYELDS